MKNISLFIARSHNGETTRMGGMLNVVAQFSTESGVQLRHGIQYCPNVRWLDYYFVILLNCKWLNSNYLGEAHLKGFALKCKPL